MGPLPDERIRHDAVVGASASPSGAVIETARPKRAVSAASSAPPRTPASMLRGVRTPFALATMGPSASHAPKRPSAEGASVTSAIAARGSATTANSAVSTDRFTRANKDPRRTILFEGLRQHARSILEHHLDLLSIDDADDVPVAKFHVPDQVADGEGLRGSVRLERGNRLPEHGLLPALLALPLRVRCRAAPR